MKTFLGGDSLSLRVSVAFGGGHKFWNPEPGGEQFAGGDLDGSSGPPGAHTPQAGEQREPE